MKTQTIIALKYLLVMIIITGLIYPLVMTGVAQVFFHSKANGSLILKDDNVIGSELIGQKFDSSVYFWSRPSVIGYNPIPSGSSNFGPASDTLKKLVTVRRELFAHANSVNDIMTVPKEMIFASASGLDPHISPEAALMQVDRISEARQFNVNQKVKLFEIVRRMTESPQFFCLGKERVNVLILNMKLDRIDKD
jgi:K+-transporting ATPase ATPase C chain